MSKRKDSSLEPNAVVGSTIKKRFSGFGVWEGTITAFNVVEKKYQVDYVDGTVEFHTLDDLLKYNLQLKTSPKPSAQKRARYKTPACSNNLPRASPATNTKEVVSTSTSSSSSTATTASDAQLFEASLLEARKLNPRKRKQRFVSIDGHTVLKSNNYGLNEGISTFSGSAAQVRRRQLPKINAAISAYGAFTREQGLGVSAAAGAAWRAVTEAARQK